MISCGPTNLTADQAHEWEGHKAAFRNALELVGRESTPAEQAAADQLAAECREELAAFWRRVNR